MAKKFVVKIFGGGEKTHYLCTRFRERQQTNIEKNYNRQEVVQELLKKKKTLCRFRPRAAFKPRRSQQENLEAEDAADRTSFFIERRTWTADNRQ